MKKKVLLISLLFIVILLSGCHANNKQPPYTLKFGAYALKQVTITNILSKETTQKNIDDIINDNIEFYKWGNLLNFSVGINENTEYFYKKDNRCYVLNEGLAFEVIEENALRLHLPYWTDSDNKLYDIVIILSWQQTYG